MTRISTDQDLTTQINVFTVDPDNQQALVHVLVEATKETMRHQPGYISASVHRSVDGSKVTNYVQWRRKEDLEAMMADPGARARMQSAIQLATSEPHLYDVVFTDGRD